MNTYFKIQFIAITALFVLLSACADKEGDGYGTLSVRMTDAPFPTDQIAEANITVSKIEVRQKEGGEDGPFITILESDVSANLLDLTNGVSANLASVEIPAGTYDLVRVYISEASVILNDDAETTYDLTVPSGAASGLKIFIEPSVEITGGLSAELLLDVDVSQSFIPQGSTKAIKGFVFKPVIKATNESFAGRLVGQVTSTEGDVTSAISGAQVSVFAADTLNTTTLTNDEGNYEVPGLIAGTYDVTVEAEGYVSETTNDIDIVAANATTTNFDLIQESE